MIAAVIGAAVGALLWFGIAALTRPETVVVETCEQGPLIDCVGYETPSAPPANEETAPVAQASCKTWLGGQQASLALLSQCLHAARARERGRSRVAGSI